MSDTAHGRADLLSQHQTPAYRAIMIAKGGTVVNAFRLSAESDEQAIEKAKAMVDGHAIELWDSLRFIEHFPPVA